jgi:hypothetical protein
MENTLYSYLQNYCSLIDFASKSTIKIINSIDKEEWKSVEFNILNRDRIITQIENVQTLIENSLQELISNNAVSADIKNIIKAWSHDTNNWILATVKSDENILIKLENYKSSTSLEIAKLFKSKQAFKGYDLSSTSP